MRVFVLNSYPPFFRSGVVHRRTRVWPPITLGIVASALDLAGHEIRFLDAYALQMADEEVVLEIERFRPDVLLFSSDRHDAWQMTLPNHGHICSFFEAYENSSYKARTVIVIGPHGTYFPDLMLEQVPAADYIVRGEPEETTIKLVEALEDGAPESMPGISYRLPDGKSAHNRDAPFITDLDALPLPAYHHMPMHLYRDRANPDTPLAVVPTSRGCPMTCLFCSKVMIGSAFRTRSIDNVLTELDLLVNEYNVGAVVFHDQFMLLERRRIVDLLNGIIERGYTINWRCQTRLGSLNREILELMKRAGCTEVHVGLESAAPSIQEAIGKNDSDTEKFKATHALGAEIGVVVSPNMVIGLPSDTVETVLESARFYHSMGFEFLLNLAIPYPDTALYDLGLKDGSIQSNDWSSILAAAGRAGNSLGQKDLEAIIVEVDHMNRKLRRSKQTFRQRVVGAPRFVAQELVHALRKRRIR